MTEQLEAPEGFQAIDLDWSSYPAIDWAQQQEVQGIVEDGRYAQYEKRGEPVVSAMVKLHTAAGKVILWESYQLREFLAKLKRGDEILVRATGQVKLPNGNKMNTFQAFVKPGKDRAAHGRVLGVRPEPMQSQAQHTFPGMEKPAQAVNMAPDFNDDIPF